MYKYVTLLYFLIIIFGNVISQTISLQNPQNKHWYQVYNEQIDGINATLSCSAKTITDGGKVLKGYLATFTSEDEWNWATDNGVVTNTAWISGSDGLKTGVWAWSDGSPEGSQPMYNLYFDKCYTFCLFGNVEPNLIVGEHWVHTSGSNGVAYWNNNGYRAVIPNYVCEFGGLEEPFVPASPTQGSKVVVSNLSGYNIANLKITFSNRDTPTSTFLCNGVTQINSTHAYCNIPVGQGKYTYVVTDGAKTSMVQYWHYELPYVGGVFTAFTAGQTVTITGANFGVDKSKISVVLGGTPNVTCGSINITQTHEVLTCVLQSAITEKFLPVTIVVSGSKFISYKAAVYSQANFRYYSGFVSSSTFDLSMNNYSAQLRVDGQVGHIGVFDSQTLATFIQQSLPVPITKTEWLLWQNIYYDPASSSFKYLTGPKKNTNCPLYYTNTNIDKSTWSTATRFISFASNFTIMPYAGSASTFTEFGGESPAFTYPNKVYYVSPAGGVVNLQIDNYGTVFSKINVTFNGAIQVPYVKDFIAGELDTTIPAGFDGPYDISVKVDDLSTPAKTQSIQYYAPVIKSITRVPTTGGLVTISGDYFSNILSNSIITFGSITCSNPVILTAYSAMTCTLPAGTGSQSVTLQVSKQKSAAYDYSYQNPVITNANNVPSIGGALTIEGSNFGSNALNIKVNIGSYSCNSVSIITAETKITCLMPNGTPSNYNLIVSVSSLQSNTYPMYIFSSDRSITQIGADLRISGTNMPSVSSLSILFSSVDITSYCSGGGSEIQCINLPNSVVSGNLQMSKGTTDIYPIIAFTLTPYISTISKQMLDTVASTTITLTGRYFESKTFETTNTIVAVGDGYTLPTSSFKLLNPQTMEVYINGGFGGGHTLSVLVGSRSSNAVTYSFFAPELLSITQDGSEVTVVGRNFSTDSSLTVLTYGVYQPNLALITSNTIIFDLSSVARNGDVYVVVSKQKSNTLTLNLTPSLNAEILPKPNINGPTPITITGSYLYKVDALGKNVGLDFYYQLTTVENTPAKVLDCSSTVENTFVCSMVSGYGYFNIYAISNGAIKTNVISGLEYVSPIVGNVSSIYYKEPGYVKVNVSNIAIGQTKITIGGDDCSSISIIDSNSAQCYFQANALYPQGKSSLNLSVVSAGLSGYNDNAFVYLPLYSCPNDCSGHGTCDKKTGLCHCEKNWNLTDCSNDMTLIDCPKNCSGNGLCDRKTGLCSCTSAWEGIDCSNRTCPNACNGNNGQCDVLTGLCSCTPAWEGIDCSNRTCPNACNGNNGQCDVLTGLCSCTPEWEGNDCSNRTCPNACNGNNGQCDVLTGLCSCTPAWEGIDCSNRTCPNACNGNNGQCDVLTGLCSCTTEWEGNDCSNRTCPNACNGNNGQCDILTGLCSCTPAWEGNDCSNRTCPNACNGNNGQCDVLTGLCSCTPAWEGNDCSNRTCPNHCSGENGICDISTGLCSCTPEWEGNDCSNRTCPNDCTNNGQCDVSTGLCSCFKGFEGIDCSNKTCPNDCSNNGQCDKTTGKCFCRSNWGGIDCSIKTTKNPELPPPIVDENGQTTFPGINLNITVSITHLREINLKEDTVKVLRLRDINWVERSNISSNYFYYKGTFKNDTAVFELVIKYFQNADTITFADEKLEMPDNSIKYQVTISNWDFNSQTNNLQAIYYSKTGLVSQYKCDDVVSTSVVGTNDFQINSGDADFNAKFASKVIVDKNIYASTSIIALESDDPLYKDIGSNPDTDFSLLTAIITPYFHKQVELDPLFSSLIKTTEQVSECESKQKWKIPVIVTLSVVGGVSVATAGFFATKHKLASKKAKDSISMSTRG
ncbi:hypothetical protein RB653_007453 [Dictyostelium firmibasis]|uniref:EGF-like domain-containing protein n=1 Tax=Dictyostelium firmibasis TaxID=79012 RepID=A0AAN7TUI4_9MYCE